MPSPPRTAFYPCCGQDFEQPARILNGHAERLVFCDIGEARFEDFRKSAKRFTWPEAMEVDFVLGDAREILSGLTRIDVFFYRNDSPGEGGSGIWFLEDPLLGVLLAKIPDEGGLIVTDGSNCWGRRFGRMSRFSGVRRHGRLIRPTQIQPDSQGLWWLRVE